MYRVILENSPEIICIVDPRNEHVIDFINKNACFNTLGYHREELIGMSILDLIHSDDLKKVFKIFKKRVIHKKNANEIRIKDKEGNYSYFEMNIKKVKMDKNQENLVIYLRDISKQKDLEKDIIDNEHNFKELTDKIPEIRFWDLFGPKDHEIALKHSYSVLGNIIENIPEYIFWKDKELSYLGCNKNYVNFLGHNNMTEVIGKTNEDLLWNGTIIKNLKIIEKKVIKSGEPQYHSNEKWILRNGDEIWLDVNRIPLKDPDGSISGILVTYQDVTEKIKYENLIVQLNNDFLNFTTDFQNNITTLLLTCCNQLQATLALYIHKIYRNDEEFFQIITNDEESYLFTRKELFDKTFLNTLFIANHDSPQLIESLDKAKNAQNYIFIRNYQIKSCYGKLIKSQNEYNRALCVLFKDKHKVSALDRLILLLLCDAIEIEHMRWEANQKLEKQNIELNKISTLKSELINRTSHELKTPLITIKGFTELLLNFHNFKFESDIVKILEEIEKGSQQLENVVEMLLETSQIERGELKLKYTEEDLSLIIKQCVEDLNNLIKSRNHVISIKITENLIIHIDKDRIYEVIKNLLSNAIKFTPPNGRIIIDSEIRENKLVISIEDNGIGIIDADKEKLFTQFGKIERFGKGIDVEIQGSGLGLYISKQIINLHGGSIWMESEGENKGCVFYFSLPIKTDFS